VIEFAFLQDGRNFYPAARKRCSWEVFVNKGSVGIFLRFVLAFLGIVFANCSKRVVSEPSSSSESANSPQPTQRLGKQSEKEHDIVAEVFPPDAMQSKTNALERRPIFYDPFTHGCWKVKVTKGASLGSCAPSVVGALWDNSQMQSDASGRVVDLTGAKGVISKVMRFVWEAKYHLPEGPRVTPLQSNTSKKAHLWTAFEDVKGSTRRYSFSTYAREADFPDDSKTYSTGVVTHPEIVAQWKGYPNTAKNEPFTIPVLTLKADRGKWMVEAFYDENEISSRNSMKPALDPTPAKNRRWLGEIAYGQWTHWRVTVKWNCCSNNGFVRFSRFNASQQKWVDDFNIQSIRIGQNDTKDPNMGIGIYKYTGSSFFSYRRIYFDNVKIEALD
jgi:hypothetical protein